MQKDKIRIIIIILLAIVFCYSAFSLISLWIDYKSSANLYEEARKDYANIQLLDPELNVNVPGNDSKEETTTTSEIDFAKLKAANKDVIGWLWIYDSTIDFPLLQATNNKKYLSHAYDGSYNRLGSIFMDYRNSSDLTDRNTIIYGHNTRSGAMFGALHKYEDKEYLETHNNFYIFTEDKTYTYEIFSLYITDSHSEAYKLNLKNDKAYSGFLKYISSKSIFDTGVDVNTDDHIVTLSTCTSSGIKTERLVIHGKLVSVTEND